jgi:protein-tyrosine phosphatase
MDLWLGSEIHVNAAFDPSARAATFDANGRYLLLELPLNDIPNDVDERLFDYTLRGLRPILAHPERNAALARHPGTVYALVQRGVLMQMNAGSLTGRFGRGVRKTALSLLDHGLVHFVGSDGHNRGSRPMALSGAFKVVASRLGRDAAQALVHDNPLKAVRGEEVWAPEPLPFDRPRRRFRLF